MRPQRSDSIPCGIALAISGGCMDAYSYLFRGHVFANAQTGNMLLFGVHLANGEIHASLRYLWPVLAFIVGIILSDVIHQKCSFSKIHWRQIAVLIEALILMLVAWIPESCHSIANMMISLACGIQVESFRTIQDHSIATTMCIGNLRSGTYHLGQYLSTKKDSYLKKACLYYGIILAFVMGAILESHSIAMLGCKAILLSPVFLILVNCNIKLNTGS